MGGIRYAFSEMRRPQSTEVSSEPHAHRGNGSGLDHHEKGPTVQEAAQWRPRFTQIDVLASGLWHHRRQFSVGQGRGDSQQSGNDPGPEQPSRAAHGPRHFGRDDEDAGSNHGTGHDHCGIEEAQALFDDGGIHFFGRGQASSLSPRPRASTNPSNSASVMGVDKQPKIPRGERMNPYSSIL